MVNPVSADGVKGHLIYTGGGNYCFRVYSSPGEFVDYAIAHNDLCIQIQDDDAYFYDELLDHSPQTLGLK
jgi:hypothetical protein